MQPLFKLQASQVCRRFYLPPESMQEGCRRQLRCLRVEVTKQTFAGGGTWFSDLYLASNITGNAVFGVFCFVFLTIYWAQMMPFASVECP